MKKVQFPCQLLLALGLVLIASFAMFEFSHAQGIIIEPVPRQPRPMAGGPVTIETHRVEAEINGPLATVHVTQVFRNDTSRTVEGVYVFPLPADAAISDFQMTVDGHVMEGQLLAKDQARRIYEEIVRNQRDPALLEYLGRGLFQTSVFPIPAGESRKIELAYSELLPTQDGLYHFQYPLRTQRFSTAPVEDISVHVELRNQPGLRTIFSPSHVVSVDRSGEDRADIGFEAVASTQVSDFDLFFGVSDNAIGLNLLSYKPATEDGFFTLLAAPEVDVKLEDVVQRDIVLVLDVSGSMEGDKIQQARDAAHFVVDHLNSGDRLNLLSFSTGVRLWDSSLQNIEDSAPRAHAWIDSLRASGSTDINRALLEGLAQITGDMGMPDGRPGYILFLTDGLPTQGEVEADRIISNASDNTPTDRTVRLFTFGVGYDVNTDLLDVLARELGGRSSYVRPDEQIDEAVSQFYDAVSTPVLTRVHLEFDGDILIDELYPFPLPDLFAGEQLAVVGRYRHGAPLTIHLAGEVNGKPARFSYPNQQLADAGGEPSVARLWATRKIGVLLDQIRRQGPQKEIVDEIVSLSLAYGVVTPFTSYLVVEPQMAAGQDSNSPTEGAGALAADGVPRSIRPTADKAAAEEAEIAASAPASGEAAVAASMERSRMQDADSVTQHESVRYVGGKTFVQQGYVAGPEGASITIWIDTLFADEMQLRTVEFGTEQYFELTNDPHMAEWLSVSPELIIVVDAQNALRITLESSETDLEGNAPTDSRNDISEPEVDHDPGGKNEESSVLQTFIDWLFGRADR